MHQTFEQWVLATTKVPFEQWSYDTIAERANDYAEIRCKNLHDRIAELEMQSVKQCHICDCPGSVPCSKCGECLCEDCKADDGVCDLCDQFIKPTAI